MHRYDLRMITAKEFTDAISRAGSPSDEQVAEMIDASRSTVIRYRTKGVHPRAEGRVLKAFGEYLNPPRLEASALSGFTNAQLLIEVAARLAQLMDYADSADQDADEAEEDRLSGVAELGE